MEFHGVPWKFLNKIEQHLWFHGIPWNLSNKTSSSMEFHGILSRSKVPWNSMELFPYSRVPLNSMEFNRTFNFPPKSPLEFHGIPWNLINFRFKKIIFLNIVFGIWLMIRCFFAQISQKRYILHWFQYCNSYFEHPSVSENGARSAKMACCYIYIYIYIYIERDLERDRERKREREGEKINNIVRRANVFTTLVSYYLLHLYILYYPYNYLPI